MVESAALAKTGYAQATRQIKSARGLEYEVFANVTSRLRAATADRSNFPYLVAALHSNRELWTLLAVDVADPANALPSRLKAQIFHLAEFTFLHTGKVLRDQGDAEVLIDINTAVMGGLRHQGGAA